MSLTLDKLKSAVSYDQETGNFTWLITRGRSRKGAVCGWVGTSGYRIMKFSGVETTIARFVWFYIHGVWPSGEIRHKNEDPSDTRFSNLEHYLPSTVNDLTAGKLREFLRYDPSTGEFTRKYKTKKNAEGSLTGAIHGTSYTRKKVTVGGRVYMAHRLAWLYIYGEWPSMDIDHIDGDACNNRIANLRLATDSQNLGNMKKPITNKSGKKGVSWSSAAKKWQSHIRIQGANRYLGLFESVDEAHAAYCKAAVEGRGEFARFE